MAKNLLENIRTMSGKLAGSLLATSSSSADSSDEDPAPDDLESSLTEAGKLLLASSFASQQASPAFALAISNECMQSDLFPALDSWPVQRHDDKDMLMAEALTARKEALKDLKEAMAMFHTELTLARLNDATPAVQVDEVE